MFPFRCSAEIESGASAVGTSELRSTSLQPGRSWWAASVLRRRLPICIVARSGAVACAPDRTSRLFRAVKTQKEKPPQDSLGWPGSGGVEPSACEERGVQSSQVSRWSPPYAQLAICAGHPGVLLPGAESNRRPGAVPRCRRVPTMYARRMCRALFWNSFICEFYRFSSAFFCGFACEYH